MSLIPDDIVSQIRERVDIVALIGEHVQLRKAGQSHKGLCPFHQEKSPSFNVNAAKGFFYCFGCQKKGDAFTFLMELEGKSFVEAAQALAERAGVVIPEAPMSPAERMQRSERSRLLEINEIAAAFYRDALRDRVRGEAGRAYLASRGIGDVVAERFRLGYAPAAWSSLAEHLASRRIPVELAEKVGLLVPRQRGGHYDRFRDRLMCPVILPNGDVAGFSGRRLGSGDDEGAKYINSPESPVYKKSHLLFGLHRAREAFHKRGRAILVEGNFDVVSLHQAGFEETVAPLGTALTAEQVDHLRRLAERVVLVYDGDPAGRAACLKALRALLAVGIEALILTLPQGEDPDSLIRTRGAAGFEALLERVRPAFEYFVLDVWGKSAQSVERKAAALEEAAEVLADVSNPVRFDLFTGVLASGLGGVDVRTLRRAIERVRAAGSQPQQAAATALKKDWSDQSAKPPPIYEAKVLAILANHPDLLGMAEELGIASLLTDARLRDMYSAARRGLSMTAALSADARIITQLLEGQFPHFDDPAHALNDAAVRLRTIRRNERESELQRQVVDAQRRGDESLARDLFQQLYAMRKQVD